MIQIYYEEEQKVHCFPFARLHFNDRLTVFFENSVIKDLVLAAESEKLAICSWKLKQKLRWYIGKHRELTQEVMDSDYDVLSFTRNSASHQMLAAANKYHKGFKEGMQKICDHIGLKVPGEVKQPIYQNAHSSRLDIYRHYVTRYLSPAMQFMIEDKEMNKIAISDSNYSQLNKANTVTSEYLMSKIGLPYYPLSPFILERLYSIFVQNEKLKVTYL